VPIQRIPNYWRQSLSKVRSLEPHNSKLTVFIRVSWFECRNPCICVPYDWWGAQAPRKQALLWHREIHCARKPNKIPPRSSSFFQFTLCTFTYPRCLFCYLLVRIRWRHISHNYSSLDKNTATDAEILQLVDNIVNRYNNGQNIYIHCRYRKNSIPQFVS
jgi:hypothetical protein